MTTRNLVALSLAATLLTSLCAVTAEAAKKPAHPMSHHTMRVAHHSSVANADHSADSLNAQSLSRAQTGQ